MKKTYDPVRDKFYLPYERAEVLEIVLFYVGVILSLALTVNPFGGAGELDNVLSVLFGVVVFAAFVTSKAIKLYFMPRAIARRQEDFCSHAFETALAFDGTNGYYNNSQRTAERRIAAQVLESSYFTSTLISQYARGQRVVNLIYIILWLACMFYRKFEVTMIVAIAQVVFSEQILSKWLRVEWLRMRTEGVYRETYALLHSQTNAKEFAPYAVLRLLQYECAKVNASILISSTRFNEHQERLSKDWDKVRAVLKI